VNQIYGAERALSQGIRILGGDLEQIIDIPDLKKIRIFRIAVAMGRGDRFPLPFGEFGKGFVHTFDEISLIAVLRELDTITDFVEYLQEKEEFFGRGSRVMADGEENLLAIYLFKGCKFPDNVDLLYVDPQVWDDFVQKEEYKAKKREDRQSYVWDRIIEEFYRNHKQGILYHDTGLKDLEYSLRVMSKENRFARRILSSSFLEFIGFYGEPKAVSRIIESPSGVIYVFLLREHDEKNRENRMRELQLRCFIARGMNPVSQVVVGIATNRYRKGGGHSYDLCHLEIPKWTPQHEKQMQEMRREMGYFQSPQAKSAHLEEYPLQ
jgi:hypothetical protein